MLVADPRKWIGGVITTGGGVGCSEVRLEEDLRDWENVTGLLWDHYRELSRSSEMSDCLVLCIPSSLEVEVQDRCRVLNGVLHERANQGTSSPAKHQQCSLQ